MKTTEQTLKHQLLLILALITLATPNLNATQEDDDEVYTNCNKLTIYASYNELNISNITNHDGSFFEVAQEKVTQENLDDQYLDIDHNNLRKVTISSLKNITLSSITSLIFSSVDIDVLYNTRKKVNLLKGLNQFKDANLYTNQAINKPFKTYALVVYFKKKLEKKIEGHNNDNIITLKYEAKKNLIQVVCKGKTTLEELKKDINTQYFNRDKTKSNDAVTTFYTVNFWCKAYSKKEDLSKTKISEIFPNNSSNNKLYPYKAWSYFQLTGIAGIIAFLGGTSYYYINLPKKKSPSAPRNKPKTSQQNTPLP